MPRILGLPAAAWLAGLAGLLPLAVYFATLAPSITWQHGGTDSGELIAAAWHLGVPHPTGYPLFLVLAHLALVVIPAAEPAYRTNLLSALESALATGLLFGAARRLAGSLGADRGAAALFALGAALSLGLAPLVWSQAILTEVYPLAVLVQCALLAALVRWGLDERASFGWLLLAAVLVGAAPLAHAMLVWADLGALLLVAWQRRRLPRGPRVLLLPAGVALGYAPVLLLPLAATLHPAYSWGAVDTLSGFVWHVTARDYRIYAFALTPAEMLLRLPLVLQTAAAQFAWLGFALALIGGWWLGERRRDLLALTLPAAIAGPLFVLGYGAETPEMYLLVALPGLALWLVAGLCWLRHEYPALRPALIVAALLLPLVLVVANAHTVSLRGDTAMRDYGLHTLASAPARAILVTGRDEQTFSLRYAQQVLGMRPDVAIVDRRILGRDWYRAQLALLYPELHLAPDVAGLAAANPGRVRAAPALPPGTGGPAAG